MNKTIQYITLTIKKLNCCILLSLTFLVGLSVGDGVGC